MKESLPLAGLRIADFTRVLSGPFCTALLGDLGAEIIKIEPPHGDDYRLVGPMKDGHSALFSVVNRNKKSMVLDLKHPEGRQLAQQIAQQVDVVVENFRPGVAAKLGIGYEDLKELNPKLIYVSVSGFGQEGTASGRPAYDIVIQALSGLMDATGFPDGPPTLVGEAITDVLSGLFASWGTLVALFARERTGQGTHVDVAMFDAALAVVVTSVSRYLFTGEEASRVGNKHPLSAPFGVFRAKDGHFVLAILNNRLFEKFAAQIGQRDIAELECFRTDELRSANEAELRKRIESWSLEKSVEQVCEELEAAGVPVAPIWNIRQALESELSLERGVLTQVEDGCLRGMRLPSQPVRFSAYETNRVSSAPELGADTEQTLIDILGVAMPRIYELRALGVFG